MIDRANIHKDYKSNKAAVLSFPKQISVSEQFWFNLLALLFGMASINGLHPFGLSYTATSVIYRKKFVSAGIFSLIGLIFAVKSIIFTRYLVAMIIFILVFLFFEEAFKSKSYLAGVLVFVSNLTAGIAFLMLKGITPYDVILLIMESLAASIMTFIIPSGCRGFSGIGPFGKAKKCVCISILVGVVLSIPQKIQIFEINTGCPRNNGSSFDGRIGRSRCRSHIGSIMGIMGYCSISIWSVSVMAFGTYFGTFKNLGRVGSVIGFALGYMIYNFYINSMGSLVTYPHS